MTNFIWKLRSFLVIFVFIVNLRCGRSEHNVALNKPIYTALSGKNDLKDKAVDGDPNSCSRPSNSVGVRQFLVVDLEAHYFIRNVSVKEGGKTQHGHFEVLVGDDFDADNMQLSLQQFRFCAEVGDVGRGSNYVDAACHAPGRFVAMRRFQEGTPLSVCDFRVDGEIQEGGNYGQSVPSPNLLTNGAFEVKEKSKVSGKIVDGDPQSCSKIDAGTRYFVAAMDGTSAVGRVRLAFSGAPKNFDVLVGHVWSPCRLRLSDFAVCAKVRNNGRAVLEVSCNLAIPGLFVAVSFIDSTGGGQLCEIKAFGNRSGPQETHISSSPLSCNISHAPKNIAMRKKGFASSVDGKRWPHKALDGNPNSCMVTRKERSNWLVVDLGGYYDITDVRLWPAQDDPMKDQAVKELAVSVGQDFRRCRQNAVQHFRPCYRQTSGQRNRPIVTECQGLGRFVAVTQLSAGGALALCELEVLGSLRKMADTPVSWQDACEVQPRSLALGATANFVREDKADRTAVATDGRASTCGSVDPEQEYLVVDLRRTARTPFVRLWQSANDSSLFDIFIADSWSSCQHQRTADFSLCGQTSNVGSLFSEGVCNGTGRFLAVRPVGRNSRQSICELEVFGDSVGPASVPDFEATCKGSKSDIRARSTGKSDGIVDDASNKDSNLARKKKAYLYTPSKAKVEQETRSVDGKTSKCLLLREAQQYLVIDLGKISQISSVKVLSSASARTRGLNQTYDVLIGDNWLPCRPELIGFFRKCGGVTSSGDLHDLARCVGEGRYIAIRSVRVSMLPICEVEVFGSYAPGKFEKFPEHERTCEYIGTNIARGKKAYSAHVSNRAVASRAVDGKTSGKFKGNSCMYLDSKRNDWFVVDLGAIYEIESVRLWRRTDWQFDKDTKRQMKNLTIAVGKEFRPCRAHHLDQFVQCAATKTLNWNVPMFMECKGIGRYISVRQNAVGEALCLCEVEVFGKLKKNAKPMTPAWREACGLQSTSNVARKKPAYTSGGTTVQKIVTDGKLGRGSILTVESREKPWILVDLQAIHNVSLVRIFGLAVAGVAEVRVGSDWSPCRQQLVHSFVKCSEIADPSGVVDEVTCPQVNARYVAVLGRHSISGELALTLEEMEVFTEGKPFPIKTQGVPYWKKTCTFAKNNAVNAAYRKPVYAGKKRYPALVDGKANSCAKIDSNGWFIIDLQDVYEVQAIRLRASTKQRSLGLSHFEVRLLRTFHPCRLQNIRMGSLCGRVEENSEKVLTVECHAVGQFVAVSFSNSSYTTVCDVEVFGEKKEGFKRYRVFPDRPVLHSKTLTPPEIRSRIVSGVASVEMQKRSGAIVAASANSEPIITNPGNDIAFLVASTLGSGRVLAAGHTSALDEVRKDQLQIWRQAVRWLTKGQEPNFVEATAVTASAGIGPETVVLWNGMLNVPSKTAGTIKELVKRGKASLFFALRGASYKSFRNATFKDVMREAGIYIHPRDYSFVKKTKLSLNEGTGVVLSLENQLTYLLSSTELFYSKFADFMLAAIGYPNVVLEMANVRQKVDHLIRIFEVYVHAVAPCRNHRPSDNATREFLTAYGALIQSQALAHSGFKAPNTDYFPGAVPPNSARVTETIEVITTIRKEQHATGLYLPPGGTLVLDPADEASEEALDRLTVRVSCHTDNIRKRPEWFRFPVISIARPVSSRHIFSPFGGVVWLRSITAGRVKLRLSGAVRTPYFNVRDPKNMAGWEDTRLAPGPWAEVAGDAIVLCVPVHRVRTLNATFLKRLMTETHDFFVKSDHHLRGSDWKTSRRQRFSLDVQISAGSGHSGYPIMAFLGWGNAMFDYETLRTEAAWGICHEIGHNMQRRVWTFEGTSEVTNNVMVLYNRHTLGAPFFNNFTRLTKSLDKTKDYLTNSSGIYFEGWKKNPGLALLIYAQLAEHFGFAVYKKAFRMYTAEKINPKDNDENMELWMITSSRAAGYNLSPLFDFWGFNITDRVKERLRRMTPFLPDDMVTQLAPARVQTMVGKYSGTVRRGKKVPDPYVKEMENFSDISPNDVVIL